MAASLTPAPYSISELVYYAIWSGGVPLQGNLGPGMAGVISRSWNSKRTLVFAHVILTKTSGIHRSREIRVRITRRMDLWERG